MAISVVTTAMDTTGDASVSVDLSAGSAGDVAIVATSGKETTPAPSYSMTGGFTELFDDNLTAGTDRNAGLFIKVLAGTETTETLSVSGTVNNTVHTIILSGVSGTYVWAGPSQAFNNPNPTPPAVTTSDDGSAIVVGMGCLENDISALGAPTGYTLSPSSTFANDENNIAAYLLDSGAAGEKTPGAFTNTTTGAAADGHTWTIALSPAGGSTDATATPTVVTADGSVPAPTPSATSNATVTAVVVTTDGSVPSATATAAANATIVAVVVTADGSVGVASVTAGTGATVTPTTVTAVGSVESDFAAVSDATATATVVTADGSVAAATVTTSNNATVTPTTVTADGEVPAPTPSAEISATVSASVVTADGNVETVAILAGGSATVTPAVVTVDGSVGAVAPTSDVTVLATTVTASGEILAVTTAAGAGVTAEVVTATGAVLSVTVITGKVASDTRYAATYREPAYAARYREKAFAPTYRG